LTPINQVQIQVWISETNETGLRDIGANLTYTRVARGKPTSGAVEQIQAQTFINPWNSTFNVTLPAPDMLLFPPQTTPPAWPIENLPKPLRPDLSSSSSGTQTQSGAGMVMSIIHSGFGTIDGVFRGIEQKSDGDLISKPELLVIDNGIAVLQTGVSCGKDAPTHIHLLESDLCLLLNAAVPNPAGVLITRVNLHNSNHETGVSQ
jgi:type II secretory pathway component GspD/PulD (secretin)